MPYLIVGSTVTEQKLYNYSKIEDPKSSNRLKEYISAECKSTLWKCQVWMYTRVWAYSNLVCSGICIEQASSSERRRILPWFLWSFCIPRVYMRVEASIEARSICVALLLLTLHDYINITYILAATRIFQLYRILSRVNVPKKYLYVSWFPIRTWFLRLNSTSWSAFGRKFLLPQRCVQVS